MEITDELIEKLASEQHAIWAHWMNYMFSCGELNEYGEWVMPEEKAQRWTRQMLTPYHALTEREQESDRHQALKIVEVLNGNT